MNIKVKKKDKNNPTKLTPMEHLSEKFFLLQRKHKVMQVTVVKFGRNDPFTTEGTFQSKGQNRKSMRFKIRITC